MGCRSGAAFGELTAGWARGRLHDAERPARRLRRVLAGGRSRRGCAWFSTVCSRSWRRRRWARSARLRASTRRWLSRAGRNRCFLPSSSARRNAAEARSCRTRPRGGSLQALAIAKSRARAVGLRAALHSRSSTNRPADPSTPTLSSRPRSKVLRRRPKCPRSLRRRK